MAKTAKQQKAGQRSAEKSRKAAANANGEKPATQNSITQFPTQKVVKDLLKAAREKKEADVDNSTDYAGKVKLAQQNHLNKDAFNVIKRLDGWTPEKQADFLEHFDEYLVLSGIEERAASAPRFEGIGGPKDDPARKAANATTEEFQEDAPRTGFPTPATH